MPADRNSKALEIAEMRGGRRRLDAEPDTALKQHADTEDSPITRAELARARAAELLQRRAELTAGVPASVQAVVRARRRAQEALDRARRAHRAAADRHTDAGLAHRRAAAAHEQAALLADDDSAAAHQDAAERHRDAAQRHDAAAAAELDSVVRIEVPSTATRPVPTPRRGTPNS